LHAILMRSIGYAKYGQENGPFGPATVELEYKQACASCNYPLDPEWRCCPVCEKPV